MLKFLLTSYAGHIGNGDAIAARIRGQRRVAVSSSLLLAVGAVETNGDVTHADIDQPIGPVACRSQEWGPTSALAIDNGAVYIHAATNWHSSRDRYSWPTLGQVDSQRTEVHDKATRVCCLLNPDSGKAPAGRVNHGCILEADAPARQCRCALNKDPPSIVWLRGLARS